MKIFLDSCNIGEIERLFTYGVVDGITTNPSLIAKEGGNFESTLKAICSIIKTSVSVEVIATEYNAMLIEADKYIKIGPQITIKLPMTWDGIMACKKLSSNGIKTNMTLCFTPLQALLAAKAGATYVSPFIGRLDDVNENGISLIADIKQIFSNYDNLSTQILAASIRSEQHIIEAAKLGADLVTISGALLEKMVLHPLTDKGLKKFLDDWHGYVNT